jgi:ATP-binding cassette subfamily B multidrug efflux pump
MWTCAEGARSYLAALTACTAVLGVFEAGLFSILGHVVDWLSAVEPSRLWIQQREHILALGGIVFGSTLLVGLQSLLKRQTLIGNFGMRLCWDFHRNILEQGLHFFHDEFAGRVASKVMQTALAVRDAWLILGDMIVFAVIYLVTTLFVAGNFDRWLLAPFLGWLFLYAFSAWYFVPRLGKGAKTQADARSLMAGRITDAYINIATVKLFSYSRREALYGQAAMAEFLGAVHRQMQVMTRFETVHHALSMGLLGSTAGVALWLWAHGMASVGAVAAAIAMALRLHAISRWIMWESAALFENVGTIQDGIGILAHGNSVMDQPNAEQLQVTDGEIHFESVTFTYARATVPVIEGLSLHIRAGEKIGLVGRSGAGKSTIVNLLLRFYNVSAGIIRIDEQNIARVTQDSLRSKIGMVTQDTSLLNRSVRDNLLYGRPDASEMDMIRAAKRAEAHDFITTLADGAGRTGYDAHVGERGVKLSGGQRQRIAIARVMLKDAPLLLLDEATSALDSEVEAAIQKSLYRLMQGKTVIAVAHRLSTIAAMDRLIVLDKGRIVEEGDHSQLLTKGGLYERLWARQSGGFLGELTDEFSFSASLRLQ